MLPTLSVIVPVYKAESYLRRCVDSILNQPYEPFELLLIDDGSPDGSGEICDRYAQKDRRVHVIHQKNAGVSSARNAGLEHASGEWITFIDADDYLSGDYFSVLKEAQADILFQGWKTFGDYCDYTEPMEEGLLATPEKIRNFLTQHLDTLFMRTPWGKFYRKTLIGTSRFDTRLIIGEDTVFLFDYLKKCSSIQISRQAEYMYLLRFNDRRRDMPPQETVAQFHAIYHAYRQLHVEAPNFLKQVLLYYFSLCNHRTNRKKLFLWFDDPVIQQARREIQGQMTPKEKRKYAWKHFLASLRRTLASH